MIMRIKFFFIVALTVAFSSYKSTDCITADLKGEHDLLCKALNYKDNWEYLSSDETGASVIHSKRHLKEFSIVPLPVLSLNKELYMANKDTSIIQNFYKKDDDIIMGFLLEGNSPKWVLKMRRSSKTSLGGESANAARFYDVYERNEKCFYFDNTFKTFAYFSKKRVFIWSNKHGQFIDALDAIRRDKVYNHFN